MRQIPAITRSRPPTGAQAKLATCDQERMMRGLIHGVILSLAVWVTAGYVTFVLR
ncbi:hypothetical protein [Rhodopila sp.]|uniref:hypothetical protein n=1 Tax=Rhodopila sp. TaxID=2480087 RepID=UPI003D0D79A0